MRTSTKLELGRYLCEIDWSLVEQTSSCEEKLKLFESFVKTGLDIITPIKKSQVHIDDSLWVTLEFKRLIKLRQKAFFADDSARFRHYSNAVNRERKVLRSEEHTSELQSRRYLVCRLLLEKKKKINEQHPAKATEKIAKTNNDK